MAPKLPSQNKRNILQLCRGDAVYESTQHRALLESIGFFSSAYCSWRCSSNHTKTPCDGLCIALEEYQEGSLRSWMQAKQPLLSATDHHRFSNTTSAWPSRCIWRLHHIERKQTSIKRNKSNQTHSQLSICLPSFRHRLLSLSNHTLSAAYQNPNAAFCCCFVLLHSVVVRIQ